MAGTDLKRVNFVRQLIRYVKLYFRKVCKYRQQTRVFLGVRQKLEMTLAGVRNLLCETDRTTMHVFYDCSMLRKPFHAIFVYVAASDTLHID